MVVGDEDQCLVEGTEVTMGDGSKRPIEQLSVGDEVLSCHGGGEFRPARVSGVFKAWNEAGVAIETFSGRRIVSTSEHTHLAGYRLGTTPQIHLTYLMWKRAVGFRVGTSGVYTQRGKAQVGIKQRCLQEHADAVWVIFRARDRRRGACSGDRALAALCAANGALPAPEIGLRAQLHR